MSTYSPASAVHPTPSFLARVSNQAQFRALVVDDDPAWLAECRFMLECIGIEAFYANNAQNAIDVATENQITLALVDYDMPDMDGISLVEALHNIALQRGGLMRVIMITGHATVDLAVSALRAAVVDFLLKPVNLAELRAAVQRANGIVVAPAPRIALIEKLSSLSIELNMLSGLLEATNSDREIQTPLSGSDTICPDFIRSQLKYETKRRSIKGGNLFGDPTWSMLLDLLLARLEGRIVSVSSACIASGAPTSTAMRLVRRLVSEGILIRIPDKHDGRRDFLELTDEMANLMMDCLKK